MTHAPVLQMIDDPPRRRFAMGVMRPPGAMDAIAAAVGAIPAAYDARVRRWPYGLVVTLCAGSSVEFYAVLATYVPQIAPPGV